MDLDDTSGKDPETQLGPNSRKKPEVGDDPIQFLKEIGWSIFENTTVSTIFMPGQIIFEGWLHGTHKLCVCGKIVVMRELNCDCTLMLQKGSIQCPNNPAIVKNLVVSKQGHIYGDIQATDTACINGTFTVSVKLTITGELMIKGTLSVKPSISLLLKPSRVRLVVVHIVIPAHQCP
ncbi:hypothetical protein F5B22DRAFT_641048 [Xylaria bambusicola]|uniref:uncharacterized protein n=1 Tax=Xylaria bambusicola TaxID=326684 RepID=UPI0020073281|nr:uncharacterized protein F5B22DRAFT_641048 [Xylaria bambusicola]KAI0528076.1 hypothetical protein F5B22DRAFT_641048 [Xylaria bambusicola]